jgi:putative tricarboxylic transport membrane protein
MIENVMAGLELILTPTNVFFIAVGVLVGLIVGAIPGIGPPVGIALLLPLTIPLNSWAAIPLMVALYVGAMYGGAVSAIIINVPGTPGAIASTFDGYPLAKQGKAKYALEVSVLASSFGTILAAMLLILSAPLLIEVVLLFGTPEYALVAVLGLTIIPLVSQASMSKSLVAAALGVLLSTVGTAPMTARPRFTFGLIQLVEGLEFVAVLLGVFAIAEMLKLSATGEAISSHTDSEVQVEDTGKGIQRYLSRIYQIFVRQPLSFVQSMVLGLGIGFIPAAGGSVSNIVAYAAEKARAGDSDSFGRGNIKGLIASESANSGTIAGSVVPLLAFGIPGSATTAIILGGMIMHGIRPGPGLFTSDIEVSYAMFAAIALAGVLLLVVGLLTVTQMAKLTKVSTDLFIPLVIILSMLGSYALNLNYVDVVVAGAFGLLGYFMAKHDYSLVAFIMGLILGPIIEENGFRSLQLQGVEIFWQTPQSTVLLVLIFLTLLGPLFRFGIGRYRQTA